MDTAKAFFKNLLLVILSVTITSLITSRCSKNSREENINSSEWAKLELVLKYLDLKYVDTIDRNKITEEILPELLSKLDPHTTYQPPVDREESVSQLQGDFEGIGIVFNVPEDTATVINIIVGGPSEKAGLQQGDKILKLDGRTVAGVKFAQDSLVRSMKGPAGSKLNMLVLRDGEEVSFEITRDKIPQHCIDVSYMLNDTTAYIKLSKFSRSTHEEFKQHAKKMSEQGMKKLVFDLRDNTGGYLDQALLLGNEFLERGDTIVYIKGEKWPRKDYIADGKGSYQDVELVVLINENTASSSEIFSGAIQDNDRGTLYGRRSYGKGLVQEPIILPDNSGLRLTVARFYTPDGHSIQRPYHDTIDDGYLYNLIKRYNSGEMSQRDSIPRDHGGIIPDVFVPVDTVGVTDLWVNINRRALGIKFSSRMASKYRVELREADQMSKLEVLLDKMNIEQEYISYLKQSGLDVPMDQWSESKYYLLPQARALIGRYSKLQDNAFYPILGTIDRDIRAVIESENSN